MKSSDNAKMKIQRRVVSVMLVVMLVFGMCRQVSWAEGSTEPLQVECLNHNAVNSHASTKTGIYAKLVADDLSGLTAKDDWTNRFKPADEESGIFVNGSTTAAAAGSGYAYYLAGEMYLEGFELSTYDYIVVKGTFTSESTGESFTLAKATRFTYLGEVGKYEVSYEEECPEDVVSVKYLNHKSNESGSSSSSGIYAKLAADDLSGMPNPDWNTARFKPINAQSGIFVNGSTKASYTSRGYAYYTAGAIYLEGFGSLSTNDYIVVKGTFKNENTGKYFTLLKATKFTWTGSTYEVSVEPISVECMSHEASNSWASNNTGIYAKLVADDLSGLTAKDDWTNRFKPADGESGIFVNGSATAAAAGNGYAYYTTGEVYLEGFGTLNTNDYITIKGTFTSENTGESFTLAKATRFTWTGSTYEACIEPVSVECMSLDTGNRSYNHDAGIYAKLVADDLSGLTAKDDWSNRFKPADGESGIFVNGSTTAAAAGNGYAYYTTGEVYLENFGTLNVNDHIMVKGTFTSESTGESFTLSKATWFIWLGDTQKWKVTYEEPRISLDDLTVCADDAFYYVTEEETTINGISYEVGVKFHDRGIWQLSYKKEGNIYDRRLIVWRQADVDDIDGVDVRDLVRLLKGVQGMTELSECAKLGADMDSNDAVERNDAVLMRKYLVSDIDASGNSDEDASGKSLTIGAWCGSMKKLDSTQFENLKNADINLYVGSWSTAEAEQNGNTDGYTYDASYFNMAADAGVELLMDFSDWDSMKLPYLQYSAYKGGNIKDEPTAAEFQNLATKKASWDASGMAEKLFYVNLLPGYSEETSLGGTYESYVQNYINTVKPDVVSLDHYAVYKSGSNYMMRTSFFSDMDTCSYWAKKKGIPFWYILLSSGHLDYETPTEEMIRWQMAVGMTYGATGLIHYVYASHEDDYSAMVDLTTGETNEVYTSVMNANKEVTTWDHIYMNYEWQGTGTVRASSATSYIDSCAHAIDVTQNTGLENISSTQDVICGVFEKEDGNEAFMITNATNPYDKKDATVTLEFDSKYSSVSVIRKGISEIIALNNGSTNITVGYGEGVFVIPLSETTSVKVNFNVGGVKISNALNAANVNVYGVYGTLPEPVAVDGYSFEGWYLDQDFHGDAVTASTIVSIATEHTLYAKWTEKENTFSFDTGAYSADVFTVKNSGLNLSVTAYNGNKQLKITRPYGSTSNWLYLNKKLKAGTTVTMTVTFDRKISGTEEMSLFVYGKNEDETPIVSGTLDKDSDAGVKRWYDGYGCKAQEIDGVWKCNGEVTNYERNKASYEFKIYEDCCGLAMELNYGDEAYWNGAAVYIDDITFAEQ